MVSPKHAKLFVLPSWSKSQHFVMQKLLMRFKRRGSAMKAVHTFLRRHHMMWNEKVKGFKAVHILLQGSSEAVSGQPSVVHGFVNSPSKQADGVLNLLRWRWNHEDQRFVSARCMQTELSVSSQAKYSGGRETVLRKTKLINKKHKHLTSM